MNPRTRGDGRIFSRKGSSQLWCAYYLRNREYRQSTGETDPIKAERFLKRKIKEIGADQIGAKAFVGPQQERIKVNDLLDALETDFKLRGIASAQFRSHLKHIRGHFGLWRALEVTPEKVDKFIAEMQDDEVRTRDDQPGHTITIPSVHPGCRAQAPISRPEDSASLGEGQ